MLLLHCYTDVKGISPPISYWAQFIYAGTPWGESEEQPLWPYLTEPGCHKNFLALSRNVLAAQKRKASCCWEDCGCCLGFCTFTSVLRFFLVAACLGTIIYDFLSYSVFPRLPDFPLPCLTIPQSHPFLNFLLAKFLMTDTSPPLLSPFSGPWILTSAFSRTLKWSLSWWFGSQMSLTGNVQRLWWYVFGECRKTSLHTYKCMCAYTHRN